MFVVGGISKQITWLFISNYESYLYYIQSLLDMTVKKGEGNMITFAELPNYLEEFFEISVKNTPDTLAVDDQGERFSYVFLEERANRVARILLEVGCGSNERVCIFTGKNIHAYSGVLGTLKSGACWVPLGENFPEERLEYLISSVTPKVIIVEAHTLEKAMRIRSTLRANFAVLLLGGTAPSPVIDEDAIASREPSRPVLDQRSPEDLAYIIFTSGSTGSPKGVMVYHRNIVHFLRLCFDYFQLKPHSRFAHHSELTFDPSLFDLFYCWGTGGTLIPFNRRRYRINPGLFVKETGVNVWFSVPSAIGMMHKAGQIGTPDLDSIKHLILTGEAVDPKLVNLWRREYPECKIYNVYGTTETAIISHWHRFDEDLDPARPAPVGKPLPGVGIFLMDGDQLVTRGEVGECVVYGSQISPGYWCNEAENVTRFVRNPLNPVLPQMVFRTGDLLRQRADGIYEYVGRTDSQVKILGHRIELREVESAIMLYPGIEETIVVDVKESRTIKEPHLVAFIVAEENVSAKDIRAFLSKKLPQYMVPLAIRQIQGPLPRNAHHKIDRSILKNMAADSFTARQEPI